MEKKKKRLNKNLNQRILDTPRKVLDLKKFKIIENKRLIYEATVNISNHQKKRDRNIRSLIKNKFPETSQITRAYKRNIIHNQNEIVKNKHFIICKQRSERRRNLFATKRAGTGIKNHKPKNYTLKSNVRC